MEDNISESNSKLVRLVDYLTQLASLRTKLIREITDYEKIIWVSDIPHEEGCFTQAWDLENNDGIDSDIWIEIQAEDEPERPKLPNECIDWIEEEFPLEKETLPKLLTEITIQVKNPTWREGSDEPKSISQTNQLEDFPKVKQIWESYLEEQWGPWLEGHKRWKIIYKVYESLFAIHQKQLRLGEEYELVLGIGLLTWKTPTGQRVCRHLIVANALVEFEARLRRFTVRPMSDGAKIRHELDMLAISEQPDEADTTTTDSLANQNDNPWDKNCIEAVLQTLVHSIHSQGEYDGTLKRQNPKAADKPIVEYAPALILRKRSTKGLTDTLERIRELILSDSDFPPGFGDIAEAPKENTPVDPTDKPRSSNGDFSGEVFFPKPSNEEQRRILGKIQGPSGVLVQGPPGTGKSHTIANLICHLLATGQRILITAKTPRALQVLQELVPEELRPLCISLLGSGLEEKRSLESSVGGILRKYEEWDEDQVERERIDLEKCIQSLRKEKTRVTRRLRDLRESETHSQSVAEGTYRGTAAKIAEAVNNDRSKYKWFTDTVPPKKPCPVNEASLRKASAFLQDFIPEKRGELDSAWPTALIDPESIAKLIEDEEKATDEETLAASGANVNVVELLSKSSLNNIEVIQGAFLDLQNTLQNLTASPHGWMPAAMNDILRGNPSFWKELCRVTKSTIAPVESLVGVADDTSVDFPMETNVKELHENTRRLKAHLENGGKLGWGPFRPKRVKDCLPAFKTVRVNGRRCSDLDDFSTLLEVLGVHLAFDKAWGLWKDRSEKHSGHYHFQLTDLSTQCETLEDALSIEVLIEKCRESLRKCPEITEPVWHDKESVEEFGRSCRLALARHRKRTVTDRMQDIESSLSSLNANAKNNVHSVTDDLIQAIRERDIDVYASKVSEVQHLQTEREQLQKVDGFVVKLRGKLPKLTDELTQNPGDSCWDERAGQIQEAWHWAQARHWLEEHLGQADAPALAKQTKQLENKISDSLAKLASLLAWSSCNSRLTENHCRHMQAWQQSMRQLGKGTGKHAPRHRREAQGHLSQCREAVPAWVMPLHRIWDTVDPSPGMFDYIIVDEASQCGFESLPLFYLGKKVLIIGDDKQISPEAVGQAREDVHRLMKKFLSDFEFQSAFDIESSLFDHGKRLYGTQRITLREHFRCMPEIIRFSNDLCYADTPLIPLRQYEPDRLPPLEHVFVEEGYREGKNTGVINLPEAEAVVKKIIELCKDSRYSEKTMGVIVLQGNAQAGLIEGQLLEQLGAEEMEKRRLVCGDPYSFQGDARDIIFLSMVAASNERIGPYTRPADERRFNVAASRARDQMWLFHSVTIEDLSETCLRRRLLEFFEGTKPTTPQIRTTKGRSSLQLIWNSQNQQECLAELEQHVTQDNRNIGTAPSPFDSWLEVDVALELLRKGFLVIPQYEVAGRRIDLVIQGTQGKLAVECDGDHWHGADQYEADMQRQRQLERCGWEFFRVRGSAFYANKKDALDPLWQMLEIRDILPKS